MTNQTTDERPRRSQCKCPCHRTMTGIAMMHMAACCIPDEAAVDIVERLRDTMRQHVQLKNGKDRWEAADEIQSLRAQLTAATQRAEQAERMLAERDSALQLTRAILCKVEIAIEEMGDAFAGTVDASWKRIEPIAVIHGKRFVASAKKAMSAIRSAASGEQGA